jgi:hypothetical protein
MLPMYSSALSPATEAISLQWWRLLRFARSDSFLGASVLCERGNLIRIHL